MEKTRSVTSISFSIRHVWTITFAGGAVLASVAIALRLAFGNLLLVLLSPVGFKFMIVASALYLVMTLFWWLAEKVSARGAESAQPFAPLTTVRLWLLQIKIGALCVLAVGWLAVAFIAPVHQVVMRDAFFFVFIGMIFFAVLPLAILDIGLQALRAMAGRTASP